MEERDLNEADRIVRLAFGTFLGLPEPMKMFGDSDLARTRFYAAPEGALAAEADGKFVGSNYAARWGSFGYFGPLSVEPRLWDQGVAKRLLGPTVELFERWGCTHAGLFTFSHSPKHAALYQKFDFWPRFLTAVMSKPVEASGPSRYARFSELTPAQKEEALAGCAETTSAIYDGLDVAVEIRSVDSQRLGDTILRFEGSKVAAFAVCHAGARSEAGSGGCYVKFGAVRPGNAVQHSFEDLIAACEAFAAAQGASQLEAGVNTGRIEAYKILLGRGFRTGIMGVAMQKANDVAFNRPGVYIIDDWR
jgi:GNAT superfamily N-acetyltransferase